VFKGAYSFFDYKYNILGYSGQDYGGFPQYLYLGVSICLLIVLLAYFRNLSKKKVLKIIRFLSIFLISFYVIKTTWESYYDIKLDGSFNWCLLPFDSCSIVMLAGLLAGFTKGKVKEYADAWLTTGGIVGAIGAMLYLNAFKYYPFLSFGAFYSMIWHFLMVFLGLLLAITNYVKIDYKIVLKGFIFHFLISIGVIIIDFVFDFDFMMYKHLGGIPIFEGVASELESSGLIFLNPLLMLGLYFLAFNIVFLILMFVRIFKPKRKKHIH